MALELPGRGLRQSEHVATSIQGVVEALIDAWPTLHPEPSVPFSLFGHSMGAMIAYALACEFERRGAGTPRRLFVSGTVAPGCFVDQNGRLAKIETRDGLIEELDRLNGTPAIVKEMPELLDALLPILQSDFRLSASYQQVSARSLDTGIVALGGEEDPSVGIDELQRWSLHTRRRFQCKTFPGDHFYLNKHWKDLAHLIAAETLEVHA